MAMRRRTEEEMTQTFCDEIVFKFCRVEILGRMDLIGVKGGHARFTNPLHFIKCLARFQGVCFDHSKNIYKHSTLAPEQKRK